MGVPLASNAEPASKLSSRSTSDVKPSARVLSASPEEMTTRRGARPRSRTPPRRGRPRASIGRSRSPGSRRRGAPPRPRSDASATVSPSSEGSSRAGAPSQPAAPPPPRPRVICPTSCSIQSLPDAIQLPTVPSAAMSTALGVPFAWNAAYSRRSVVQENLLEPVLVSLRLELLGAPSLAKTTLSSSRVLALPPGGGGQQGLARAAVRAREQQQCRQAGPANVPSDGRSRRRATAPQNVGAAVPGSSPIRDRPRSRPRGRGRRARARPPRGRGASAPVRTSASGTGRRRLRRRARRSR